MAPEQDNDVKNSVQVSTGMRDRRAEITDTKSVGKKCLVLWVRFGSDYVLGCKLAG